MTRRRWVGVTFLAALLLTEAVLGGRDIAAALGRLTEPDWLWVIAAVLVELASMGAHARMQRRLLRGEGVTVTLPAAVRLAYAAHALSISLPGSPAFSTAYNFRRMRDLGASPAVASSCIALSGVLSSAALVVVAGVAELLRGGHQGLVATALHLGLALALVVGVRALVRRPGRLLYLAGCASGQWVRRSRRWSQWCSRTPRA